MCEEPRSHAGLEEWKNVETVQVVANTEVPSDSMAKNSMSCHISKGRRSIGASIGREDAEYVKSVERTGASTNDLCQPLYRV